MKKYAAALVVIGLCLTQGGAIAQTPSCFTTMTQGSGTVALGAYEQSCPTITWGAGVITKDVQYNCCIAAPTIRVNANDWERLRQAGKLDGFRYQKISKDANDAYILEFKKIVGTTPTLINPADFN